MRLPTRQAVLFFFAGSLMLSASASGVRANDPCVANGTTLLCQGDQADGLDLTNTAFDTLIVNSLTGGIATTGVSGIFFVTDNGGPLTLRSDTGPFGIWTTGDDAPGVVLSSLASFTDAASVFSSGGVSVFSSDAITTSGVGSYGIVAETLLGLEHSSLSVTARGGQAVVTSSGPIVTHGDMGVGIEAIGGVVAVASGAGTDAEAVGGDIAITSRDVQTFGDDAVGISAGYAVVADASASAAAAGGEIVVNNAGLVTTRGSFAHGISIQGLTIVSGANSTATVSGTKIGVTSRGIETSGDDAIGISVLQGAGAISDGVATARTEFSSVHNVGEISTHGAFAQGIGVDVSAFAVSISDDAVARGGDVLVVNDGAVITRGVGSGGIAVQSAVTAETGAVGTVANAYAGAVTVTSNEVIMEGDGLAAIAVLSFASAIAADEGHAGMGAITVNSHNVTATESGVVGIVVFGAALNTGASGTTTSAGIVINSTGALIATGEHSWGIQAGSIALGPPGGAVQGDLAVNIVSGSVTGGSGSGGAIQLVHEGRSTITNHGVISALSGLAVEAGLGEDVIENWGMIRGDVLLDAGANAFNNRQTGVFAPGALVYLGVGNALTNEGVLSPGGAGAVQVTALTGDIVQGGSGRYLVDVDFGTGASDRVDASGSVVLAGTVVANSTVVGTGFSQQFHILHAAGGVTDDGLAAADTAVVDYSVIFDPNGQDVHLGAVIDFSGRGTGLNPNQTRIGQGLNLVQANGVPASMAAGIAALMNVPTTADLGRAYDQLSPETFGQQLTEAQVASEDFSNALMSCREAGGPNAAIREGECLWARARASDVDVAGSATNIGSKSRVGSFAAGLQVAMAADWRIGVALGYDLVSRSTPSGASTDGDRTNVGAVVKYNPGPFLLAAGAAAGWGTFETDRRMAFGGFAATATSKSDTDYVIGWLHAAYLADQGRWYLKPHVEARVTELDFSGARDTGGGGLGLVVSGSRDTMISVSPALEVGTEFRFDALAVWRPFVRAGVTWRDEDTFVTQAAFAGAPLGVPGFHIVTDVDDVLFDISAGVDVIGGDGAVLKVQYDGRFGSTLSQNSVSLKGSVPF